MFNLEQTAEVLKGQKDLGIFDVQINPNGYVSSQLENRADPNRPYSLTVRPLDGQRTLKIRISVITLAEYDNPIPGVIASAAVSLGKGELRIDSEKGISFEVSHICPDGDDGDLSPEVVEQLIDGLVRNFRQFEILAMQGQGLVETLMKISSPM